MLQDGDMVVGVREIFLERDDPSGQTGSSTKIVHTAILQNCLWQQEFRLSFARQLSSPVLGFQEFCEQTED